MVVTIHKDGRDGMGLLIGTTNARRYISKRAQTIDLRLDDLQIQCRLSPDFWDGPAEIHDPRLSEWLEFKVGRVPAGCEPIQLAMVLSADGAYIVTPSGEPRRLRSRFKPAAQRRVRVLPGIPSEPALASR